MVWMKEEHYTLLCVFLSALHRRIIVLFFACFAYFGLETYKVCYLWFFLHQWGANRVVFCSMVLTLSSWRLGAGGWLGLYLDRDRCLRKLRKFAKLVYIYFFLENLGSRVERRGRGVEMYLQ